MIPSLVQQITAACPEPTYRANPRRERMENILMLMLGRNASATDMARHYKKSMSALTQDLRELQTTAICSRSARTMGITNARSTASRRPECSGRSS